MQFEVHVKNQRYYHKSLTDQEFFRYATETAKAKVQNYNKHKRVLLRQTDLFTLVFRILIPVSSYGMIKKIMNVHYLYFSAGIGRTGALITLDVALGLMERDLPVCTCT